MAAIKRRFIFLCVFLRDVPALRRAFSWTCLSLLLGLFPCCSVFAADVPSAPEVSFRLSPAFAIADLDGDSIPDLADVQIRQSNSENSVYWIDLQLSAVGRKSIRLVAPSGGLRIAARDVNGDASPDLIVSSAWSNQPVAIYLNDGHGGFRHAAPASFSEAFREFQTHWVSAGQLTPRILAVLPELRAGIFRGSGRLSDLPARARSVSVSDCVYLPRVLLFSCQDRAPPFDL